MNHARLEVCVDTAAGLQIAIEGGADRVELCSALALGGLTPSAGLMALAAKSPIPVRVMIRPRAGDFCFSPDELSQMKTDIDTIKNSGLDGVVLGATTSDGGLNLAMLEELVSYSHGMSATLHRVVDILADPETAFEAAIRLGFDTILTSGGKKTALDGIEPLKKMHLLAAGRITIMPGSGVRINNAADILNATGADWLHASCSSDTPTPRILHKLGFSPETICETDGQICSAMAEICHAKKLSET